MQKRFISVNSIQIAKKIGADIEVARLKRRLTREELATRAMISRNTMQKIIAGDPGVSFGRYIQVLVVLNAKERLLGLISEVNDTVGLNQDRGALPQRIKKRKDEII